MGNLSADKAVQLLDRRGVAGQQFRGQVGRHHSLRDNLGEPAHVGHRLGFAGFLRRKNARSNNCEHPHQPDYRERAKRIEPE